MHSHYDRQARRRNCIDVTGYWIDPSSLESCFVVRACQQPKSSHTFDVLAGALNEMKSETRLFELPLIMSPISTRWNSLFLDVEGTLRIIKDQGEDLSERIHQR